MADDGMDRIIHNGCLECYGAGRNTCSHVPRENWTKGPWFVDPEGDNDIYGLDECGDAELLATAYPMGEIENAAGFGPKQRSNARLISAAPDLYEACKKALTCASINSDVRALLLDATAKARGETDAATRP